MGVLRTGKFAENTRHTQPNNYLSLPMAAEFQETVAIDLKYFNGKIIIHHIDLAKYFNGKIIIHHIDLAKRLSVSAVIPNKN